MEDDIGPNLDDPYHDDDDDSGPHFILPPVSEVSPLMEFGSLTPIEQVASSPPSGQDQGAATRRLLPSSITLKPKP